MKFAFAVFVLISLTAVSCQFTRTWLLDWQTGDAECAPSFFTITGNSLSGYSVSYNYSSATLNMNECYYTLGITQNFTSTLTLNSTSGAYVDSKNQSLAYNSNNNTIVFLLGLPSVQDILILFSTNGAYISQEEVAGLITGVWTGPSYNQGSCVTAPPVNISIGVSELTGVNSLSAVYYRSTSQSQSTTTLSLYIEEINQIMWTMSFSGTSYISYMVSSTNQSTLQFEIPQSSQEGECIVTYSRSINLVSGTWLPDWQNGNYSNTSYASLVPTSVQVFSIYNMYMRIVFNFANSTSFTGILYPAAKGYYTDSIYGDTYYPSSNTFILSVSFETFLFSPNGSIFSADPFLGKWYNPQIEDSDSGDSDVSDYCCMPRSVGIYNLTSQYQLSALFTYDGYMANSTACSYLRQDLSDNAFLQTYLTIRSPNGSQLIWDTNSNYIVSFNNSDTSLLQLVYEYGNYKYCNFSMSGRVPPKPLSARLIAKGISAFIFALIVIFM